MNNKGFTLMEILGVITLLALISLVIIIATNKSLKDSKETLYKAQLEEIKSAAEMWKTDNITSIPETNETTITLQTLQDNGYIKKDIINPKTGEQFNNFTIKIGMNEIKLEIVE
jgi:type IV pilus assembly protein PilA